MRTLADFYSVMATADYGEEGETFGGYGCGLYVFGLVAVSTVEKANSIQVTVTSPYSSRVYEQSTESDYTQILDAIEDAHVSIF